MYPNGLYTGTRLEPFILQIHEMLSSVFRTVRKKKTPHPKPTKNHTDKTIKLNRQLIPQMMNSKAAMSSAAVI